MFRYFKLTSYFLLVFLISTQPVYAEKFGTVLIGGGLDVCTSAHSQHCKTKLAVNENSHSTHRYLLNTKNINTLASLYYADPSIQTKQMHEFLTNIGKLNELSKSYTEKGLSHFFRKSNLPDATKLDAFHWQMILDVFQERVIATRFLQRDRYKNVNVDVFNSKQLFVAKALREFVDNVSGDNILIVTAANRDAFEDVYWLIKTFEQFDLDVKWMPLDLAVAEIWRTTDISSSDKVEAACKSINETRHKIAKRYFRDRIYGDLNEELIESCSEPDKIIDLVEEADGIYFHDGDPIVLRDSLMINDIEPNHVWKRVLSRHQNKQITLAFNGGAIRALGGNEGRNGFVIQGSSKDSLNDGFGIYSNLEASKKHVKGNEPLMSMAGLGLFDGISFDSEFNNISRQGRLFGLLAMMKLPYGIGIDERTVLAIKQNANGLELKVSGEGGVTVVNNTESTRASLAPAKLTDIVMSFMTQDDTALFKDSKFSFDFANWKYSSSQYSQPVVRAGKVFRPEAFSKTMYMLCTTGARKALLKHIELGKGHVLNVGKLSNSVSVSGSKNVNGENYSYCSYRGYTISIKPN
ncbi:hypothetical protein N9W11_00735 [Psychrosphaera haliotis]|nr:hypothetical protein [Psychrosphaera haliotis]